MPVISLRRITCSTSSIATSPGPRRTIFSVRSSHGRHAKPLACRRCQAADAAPVPLQATGRECPRDGVGRAPTLGTDTPSVSGGSAFRQSRNSSPSGTATTSRSTSSRQSGGRQRGQDSEGISTFPPPRKKWSVYPPQTRQPPRTAADWAKELLEKTRFRYKPRDGSDTILDPGGYAVMKLIAQPAYEVSGSGSLPRHPSAQHLLRRRIPPAVGHQDLPLLRRGLRCGSCECNDGGQANRPALKRHDRRRPRRCLSAGNRSPLASFSGLSVFWLALRCPGRTRSNQLLRASVRHTGDFQTLPD